MLRTFLTVLVLCALTISTIAAQDKSTAKMALAIGEEKEIGKATYTTYGPFSAGSANIPITVRRDGRQLYSFFPIKNTTPGSTEMSVEIQKAVLSSMDLWLEGQQLEILSLTPCVIWAASPGSARIPVGYTVVTRPVAQAK